MKQLLFISAFLLLFACKPQNQTTEIQNLQDVVNKIKIDNERIVKRIEKECADNGNKQNDLKNLMAAQSLINQRENLAVKEYFFASYLDKLKAIYPKDIFPNQTRLIRASKLINLYGSTSSDSILFSNCYLNLLLVEQEVLQNHLINVSGNYCGFRQQAIVYKKQDTIALNDTYKFTVVAMKKDRDDYNFNIIKNGISQTVFYNNTLTRIPAEMEVIGGAIIIQLKPEKKGEYRISGNFKIDYLNSENEGIPFFSYDDYFIVK